MEADIGVMQPQANKASQVVLVGKNPPVNAGDLDSGLICGWGRCPGEGHGTPLQYSFLENPWTEEPGGLQSMGSQRVGHDWSNLARGTQANRSLQKLEEDRKDLYLELLEESCPVDPLISYFWFPELWGNMFLFFKATMFAVIYYSNSRKST